MKITWVALGIGFLAVWPVRAADPDGQSQTRHDTPGPVDPVYQAIADKTGGHVYDLRKPEDVRAFHEDQIDRPMREARWQRWKEWLDVTHVADRLPGSDETRFLIYVVLKWLAYAAWCFVGLKALGNSRRRLGLAAFWGTVRVLLGILFGITLFYIFVGLHWTAPNYRFWYVGFYLAIYVPVRWMEWSILARSMGLSSLAWRGQGIVVSCLVDGVQILLLGSLIPIGRIVC